MVVGSQTYSATPTLPDGYSNVAVYCSINGSNSVYQKSLANGVTTFNDLDSEHVGCSWFITSAPEQTGPTGSITVREFNCEGDKSTITDWDKQCVAAASGSSLSWWVSEESCCRSFISPP